MPTENDPSDPKDPGSGASSGAGTGGDSGAGSGAGSKGGSKGGASPDNNDKPPQTIVA
jgi:hypothetical protein